MLEPTHGDAAPRRAAHVMIPKPRMRKDGSVADIEDSLSHSAFLLCVRGAVHAAPAGPD